MKIATVSLLKLDTWPKEENNKDVFLIMRKEYVFSFSKVAKIPHVSHGNVLKGEIVVCILWFDV